MSDKGSWDELKDGVSGAEGAPAARLCYVDDSRTSAYVVKKLLQPYGYQIDYFQSAEPAFVALIQEDYDLLLTDLKVSSRGMDGDDLIRTLRQSGHPKLSSLPVIVITGASDARVLVEVYDAGANQVMSKPVNAEALNEHILRLLPEHKPDLRVVEQPHDRDNVVSLSAAQRPVQKQLEPEDDTETQTAPKFSSKKAKVSNQVKSSLTKTTTNPQTLNAKKSDTDIPVLDPASSDKAKSPKATVPKSTAPKATAPKATAPKATVPKVNAPKTNVPEENVPVRNVEKSNHKNSSKPQIAKKVANKTIKKERESLIERAVLKKDEQKSVNLSKNSAKADNKNNSSQAVEKHHVDVVSEKSKEVKSESSDATGATNESKEMFVESINILNDMDQHELVAKDRVGVMGGSAILGLFTSLIELVGIRSLIQRFVMAGVGIFAVLMIWNVMFDQGLAVKTAVVEAGEIFQSITVPGRVLSKQRVNISSEHTGRTVKIYVREGDRVKAGQTLAKMSKQKITAPFSGTITAIYAEVGQWLGPTESMFRLVDESRREIEVRVDAADSMSIDVGQVVAVSSDAFPGLEWHESVSRLSTAANSDRNSNSVKVYISLGNDAPTLRFGQQVDADIRTAWNPNTLKVPFEALINRDGQTLVAVLSGGQVILKPVETGIEDSSMVEIKQGLIEDELVILSKGQFLQNGDKVYSARGNL